MNRDTLCYIGTSTAVVFGSAFTIAAASGVFGKPALQNPIQVTTAIDGGTIVKIQNPVVFK